jgi:hypothetical protein
MTFLNWTMLLGFAAVAIPIVIHLLNRRRARVVDWGAMQFLLASLTAQNRRIRLEEMLLLALRCLLIALVVLALARPLLPSRPGVPWALVLPAILVGAVCAALAGAFWTSRRLRWGLLAAAGGLLLVAGVAAAAEQLSQRRLWPAGGDARDVAIVLDASDSMSAAGDGETSFDRAVKEARTVVRSLRAGDAAVVLLAGSAMETPVPAPVSEREHLLTALEEASPVGGSLNAPDALAAATDALAAGSNPGKRIVLITDGQRLGWNLRSDARWGYVSAGFDGLPTRPRTILRILPTLRAVRNTAVDGITLSRRVVGTDRRVGIDIRVANTGDETFEPEPVRLSVDGQAIAEQRPGEIGPGSAATTRFEHRFAAPGRHVLTARFAGTDALRADDTLHLVVDVLEELPVLVVNGSATAQPLESPGQLIALALSPEPDPAAAQTLVAPVVIDAGDVAAAGDLSRYRAIVLADVPRLPGAVAERLERFVRSGGGLLIAPGRSAVDRFYNEWRREDGRPLTPAELTGRIVPDEPARIIPDTLDHPALRLAADESRSDAAEARIRSYWSLAPRQDVPSVRAAGRLSTGDPLLVERRLGRGRVVLSALSLGPDDSNLPSLSCYVVALHELTAHLAEPTQPQAEVVPGEELRLELPLASRPGPQAVSAEAAGPGGLRLPAVAAVTDDALHLTFSRARRPGLYTLKLPADLAERLARPTAVVPFVVRRDPAESRLDPLGEGELSALARRVDLVRAQSVDELTSAVAGGTPGQELWRYILPVAAVVLLAEIALTRWIALRRRTHTARSVRFGEQRIDLEVLRSRAERMLAQPPAEPVGQGRT